MKTFIISVQDPTEETRFRMQNELSLSYGRSAFVEVLQDIWLLRCDAGASDVHQCVEHVLTDRVFFFIYELAESPDFVQNVESWVSDWTDVNL